MAKAFPRGDTVSTITYSRRKHIPERTCFACRGKVAKGKLIRLVRTAAGDVQVDSTGKLHGRGAYLCPFRDCWDVGLKGNRLEYTLKGKIGAESLKRLLEYRQTLPERS